MPPFGYFSFRNIAAAAAAATAAAATAAAAAVRSLATLDEIQRHNRDDEAGEGFPCANRTLCSRKRRDEDVRLGTESSSMQGPYSASRPRSS